MSWASDLDNVRHMLALGVAEREFADYIEQGLGTREKFANVFLIFSYRYPDYSMEDCAREMRRMLDQWMQDKLGADRPKALQSALEMLTSDVSADPTT